MMTAMASMTMLEVSSCVAFFLDLLLCARNQAKSHLNCNLLC